MNQHEIIAQHPHPGTDPVARLRHTLDVFGADVRDDEWAIRATHSISSNGEVTGLTWGDLRALADRLDA